MKRRFLSTKTALIRWGDGMELRLATAADIPALCEIRKKQLHDEEPQPDVSIDAALLSYFEEAMKSGRLSQWVLEDEGKIVATAALILYDFPPSFQNESGKSGYVANVYTAPDYRKRGLATRLLGVIKEEALRRGLKKLWLEASVWGRPVYKKFGFEENPHWLEIKLL